MFEKRCAIRASVSGMSGALEWVACVACLCEWCASVGDVGAALACVVLVSWVVC